MRRVWVELDQTRNFVVRIFRSAAASCGSKGPADRLIYSVAVQAIRHRLWLRCGGECELCASPVTESSGHMHEQKHRGQGGEISLTNSVFICPTCHLHAHNDRNPRFTNKSLDI